MVSHDYDLSHDPSRMRGEGEGTLYEAVWIHYQSRRIRCIDQPPYPAGGELLGQRLVGHPLWCARTSGANQYQPGADPLQAAERCLAEEMRYLPQPWPEELQQDYLDTFAASWRHTEHERIAAHQYASLVDGELEELAGW